MHINIYSFKYTFNIHKNGERLGTKKKKSQYQNCKKHFKLLILNTTQQIREIINKNKKKNK